MQPDSQLGLQNERRDCSKEEEEEEDDGEETCARKSEG
jgi:hypothetical protein